MTKKIIALFAALMIVLPVMAGGKRDVSVMEKIKADGKIVLGTSADYPPYEFHALIDGKDTIVGFDISIAQEVAKDLGVELEIKDMNFDGLLAALVSGNVDFVISGMTPTEERKQNVDFSDIYYEAVHGAVIRVADEAKYGSNPASLKDVVIGAQKGAIQVGIAKEQIKGVTGTDLDNNHPQVKELGTLPDLIMEVKNSKIEAVIAELPVAKAYVNANPDLMLAEYTFKDTEGGSAIAIKKGNADLVQAINATIARLIAEDKITAFVGESSLLADNQ
ncbi:MAG: transporter substrate-binding domain-containing protein [Spirochaetaceae bacterium]|nr:transporter substrate-binding domain-containing protein [Spirochaetaceae bacterium]